MFEYLKARDITGKTKWLDLPAITDKARLLLSPASESNNSYYNGVLKFAASRSRQQLPAHVAERNEMNQNRSDDRVLYPKYIVKGWEGIIDDQKVDVPFSQEVCLELFDVLPDWIVDQVRVFCMTSANFLDQEVPSDEAVAETAKK